MSNNKPLRRGVSGVCTRSICECERDGLGDQCVWLKPAEMRALPEWPAAALDGYSIDASIAASEQKGGA